MSSVLDIIFDRDIHGYEVADRYALAAMYFAPEFEVLAKQLGATPLTDFYSENPDSIEQFFDDPEEIEALKQKMGPEQFFDPADALKSVTLIRDHLRHNPLNLETPPSRGADRVARELIDELTEVESSLAKGVSQDARFHFVITPD